MDCYPIVMGRICRTLLMRSALSRSSVGCRWQPPEPPEAMHKSNIGRGCALLPAHSVGCKASMVELVRIDVVFDSIWNKVPDRAAL